MMKKIKFAKELVSQVKSGTKNTTWRLWDDKNLTKGDIVELIERPSLEIFAKAMYETYSKYYNREVDKNTVVKIIKFKLT